MKIGVDVSTWIHQQGYGRCTRGLLGALLDLDHHNDYLLFLDSETAACAKDLPEGQRIHRVVVKTSRAATQAASVEGHRSLFDLWSMSQAVCRRGNDLDLFFFPSVYTFFPLRAKTKVVVTIHDLIAGSYPQLVLPFWKSRFFWRLKIQYALRKANLIITASEKAKKDILEKHDLDDKKVKVIPLGVSKIFRPLSIPPGPFILYVGNFSPHKNLTTLLQAYHRLLTKDGFLDIKLVIIGDFKNNGSLTNYNRLQREIGKRGLTQQVVFTGHLPDEKLIQFYNSAVLLVSPSLDEGFGLPGLEGMACGTPVVASRAGALPEVMGEAAQFFDPHRPDELAERMEEILRSEPLRSEMRRRGLERARKFSWELSARSLLSLFEKNV